MIFARACVVTSIVVFAACGQSQGAPDGSAPGADADPGSDGDGAAGSEPDGGAPRSPYVGCAEISDAIGDETGETITVAPAGDGQVSVGGDTRSLRAVVSDASEGDTILLEDGTYTLPEADDGSYTGLYFTTPDVTLRGASGDPSLVVLDSAYRDHGDTTAPISIDAPGVVLAGFTVKRSIFHLVHLWSGADGALLHDLRLIDGGQQFVKASPGDGEYVDDVEVSCTEMRMTSEGRDNVWGYGPQDGGTTCYTGGIDTHGSRDWHIHDSRFEGIYCNAGGTPRPAHGRKPDERGGETYVGGLAEHAIHMWESEEGSGHVIERNRIANCARGIGIGLSAEVYGSVIRNNTVFSEHAGGPEHDVGIIVERAHDTLVYNNTVFFSSPDAYPNAIEYRFDSTSDLAVRNNLTRGEIRARDGAEAALGGNVTGAEASWFSDADAGDLHLASCELGDVVGAGEVLPEVALDIDGEERGDANDVGADQCAPE